MINEVQNIEEQDNKTIEPEVQNELSKVAANPTQSFLILAVICLIAGYAIFTLFFNEATPKEKPTQIPIDISRPVQANVSQAPAIPQLPEPPKLVEPTAPPPPPPPINSSVESIPVVGLPAVSQLPPVLNNNTPLPAELPKSDFLPSNTAASEDEKKRQDAKRKSNIILLAGNPERKTLEQIAQETNFKKRGDMELVLGRGKIIDAVLESAIDTDLAGEVRAVISRDVFSESGKVILIPKGSRVFGRYSSETPVYGRILLNWDRIDMANGYSLNLVGIGVDGLGRKGEQGRVDNKVKERLSNAVLMSAFNVAVARGLDKFIPPVQTAQAATQNQALATQINSIAQTISADTAQSESVRRTLICTQVQAAITDITSAAYTTFAATCAGITGATGTDTQKLATIVAAANAAATALIVNVAAQVTPTQAQTSSKQAFTDITDTVKDIISQNDFKPTITIDQGTPFKIYVTMDYPFPKAAINKSRLLK